MLVTVPPLAEVNKSALWFCDERAHVDLAAGMDCATCVPKLLR